MDFDLSLTDLDSPAAHHNLNMQPAITATTETAQPWNPANDLVNISLPDTLALAGLPQAAIAELTAPIPLPPPPSVGQKRSHAQMNPQLLATQELSTSHTTQLVSESNTATASLSNSVSHSHSHSHAQSHSHSHTHALPLADAVQVKSAPVEETVKPLVASATELLPQPEIDSHAVCQMGGLPYAELCKERAREEFKEAKRNEHLANGDFDRTKRRKKNDTSMTPRQKYIRRLRMNQDSAAAARHAQEVYVTVLEKLVKTAEAEKKTFSMEMQQIRKQNVTLQQKVCDLQDKVSELEEEKQTTALDWDKSKDPILASKLFDLIASTPVIGAPDLGVQPARAV